MGIAQASLDYERSAGGELTHVRIAGKVDETFDGRRAAARVKSKRAVINCAGVTLITSFGIRRWLEFVQELERRNAQVYFIECSPKFVEELNQVVSFAAHGRVLSAYAPYVCRECNATRSILLRVDADAHVIRERKPPSYSCLACGAVMDFDEDIASYFSGIEGHLEGEIDAVVLAFLEARLGYHADTERQLHIKKLIFDDTTVVWFGGTLDKTLKGRLAEGLEGVVVLNLSDVIHVQQAGIRAWRDFIGAASRRAGELVLVGCPALVIERALEGTGGTALEVVSVRIPYHCAKCDATEFVEVELAGRTGGEVRQGHLPRRRCTGCGADARAVVGARLLDQLMKLPEPKSRRGLSKILQRAAKQMRAVRSPRAGRNKVKLAWAAAAIAGAVVAGSFAVVAAFALRQGGGPVAAPTVAPVENPTPRFERPDWILSDLPGTSYCTEVGRTLSCVGVSPYLPSREQGEREAFEAALEALVHTAILNAEEPRAVAQRSLYLDARTAALQELGRARFDEDGPEEPEALETVRAARTGVSRALIGDAAPGAPTQRSAWHWEEFEHKTRTAATSEFLVFVRVDLSPPERDALLKHYTSPTSVGGATLSRAYPGAGWVVDLDGKSAFLVHEIQRGHLASAGLTQGDLVLLEGTHAPGELETALLAAVRGAGGPSLTVLRGPGLKEEVQLARALRRDR